MATVTLDHVTKSFRNKGEHRCAVDDLCLNIADRELLVLVGPSGCGKTTTLRLIAGLEQATSGSIRIDGHAVDNVAPRDRDVAMVFQSYALYPHMTVRKNLSFGLRMRRVPNAEITKRVDEVASMLGIGHLLDRRPGALSGGECQRVAVGRAIVRRPSVFLLDEPLSNLDAGLRAQTRTEIKTLQHDLRTTMIYVTHDQEEAMTLGDRIVVMKSGVAVQCAPPLEVYNKPADTFVARFIGTPSMNLVSGCLQREGNALYFSGPIGRVRLSEESASAAGTEHGRSVVLGIRPQHVRFTASASAGGHRESRAREDGLAPLGEMSVRIVEPLGNCSHVHLSSTNGESIVALATPTEELTGGKNVTVAIDVSRVHIFSSDERGQRLN